MEVSPHEQLDSLFQQYEEAKEALKNSKAEVEVLQEQLKSKNQKMGEFLRDTEEEIDRLERKYELQWGENARENTMKELSELRERNAELTQLISSREADFTNELFRANMEREQIQTTMTTELSELRERNAHLAQFKTSQEEVLKTCLEQLFSANVERKELYNIRELQKSMTTELIELREHNAHVTHLKTSQEEDLATCREQLFRANVERKKLHKVVMDLGGNIRVFCRLRPPLEAERDKSLYRWNDGDEKSLNIQKTGRDRRMHNFTFDYVFRPQSTQEDVFAMVTPLIQSAMDGDNVCIFAYGETGSGKTFTMDGVADNVGVIPRTVDLLFELARSYKWLGWHYDIKASFFEIYNEVLYDLLSNEQNIGIAEDEENMETVRNANHFRELVNTARSNRAETHGNRVSSRSHTLTRIKLIGRHEAKNEISIGTINLVDLAGSESPKTSEPRIETKNTIRSLSELTNVILALLKKQDHTPYRNSKLTHLLRPSVRDNPKIFMFINVAPLEDCFEESLKSLAFATSVNSCKFPKAWWRGWIRKCLALVVRVLYLF